MARSAEASSSTPALAEFQDLLLITRFASELGFDAVTPEGLDEKIRAYRGPGFLVRGELRCDGTVAGQIEVCGREGTASTWKDGAYVSFPLS